MKFQIKTSQPQPIVFTSFKECGNYITIRNNYVIHLLQNN